MLGGAVLQVFRGCKRSGDGQDNCLFYELGKVLSSCSPSSPGPESRLEAVKSSRQPGSEPGDDIATVSTDEGVIGHAPNGSRAGRCLFLVQLGSPCTVHGCRASTLRHAHKSPPLHVYLYRGSLTTCWHAKRAAVDGSALLLQPPSCGTTAGNAAAAYTRQPCLGPARTFQPECSLLQTHSIADRGGEYGRTSRRELTGCMLGIALRI